MATALPTGAAVDPSSAPWSDSDEKLRTFRCGCGVSVRLTHKQPLPDGWRVIVPSRSRNTQAVFVKVRYECPTCAGPITFTVVTYRPSGPRDPEWVCEECGMDVLPGRRFCSAEHYRASLRRARRRRLGTRTLAE